MQKNLIQLFQRDILTLYKEIEAYEDETTLWQTVAGINNSGGNLALHLIGNLKTYFGKNLGNTGYIRNREAEFSSKNIPREEILKAINETYSIVTKVLESLSDEQFDTVYPENVLGYEMTIKYFAIHLHGHLTYHVGQINYHRRILGLITK